MIFPRIVKGVIGLRRLLEVNSWIASTRAVLLLMSTLKVQTINQTTKKASSLNSPFLLPLNWQGGYSEPP